MAEWTGLEPATSGVTGRRSNQLNYHSFCGESVRKTLPAEIRSVGERDTRRGFEIAQQKIIGKSVAFAIFWRNVPPLRERRDSRCNFCPF